jgi:hypothetical protein
MEEGFLSHFESSASWVWSVSLYGLVGQMRQSIKASPYLGVDMICPLHTLDLQLGRFLTAGSISNTQGGGSSIPSPYSGNLEVLFS